MGYRVLKTFRVIYAASTSGCQCLSFTKGTKTRISIRSWVLSYLRHENWVSWRSWWNCDLIEDSRYNLPLASWELLFSTFCHSDFSQINNEVIAVRRVHSPSVTFALWGIKHDSVCAPEMRQHDVSAQWRHVKSHHLETCLKEGDCTQGKGGH